MSRYTPSDDVKRLYLEVCGERREPCAARTCPLCGEDVMLVHPVCAECYVVCARGHRMYAEKDVLTRWMEGKSYIEGER